MITQQGAAFAALCFFMGQREVKRTLQQQTVACRAGISVVY